jgi:hypothetical protein
MLKQAKHLIQKITVENQARFRYQVGYWRPLIDASICRARDDGDTQLSVFDLSALKKQLPILWKKQRKRI